VCAPNHLRAPGDDTEHRGVEPVFYSVGQSGAVGDLHDVIGGFGDVGHLDVGVGSQHIVEDPLQRLGERGRRVLAYAA